MPEYGKQTRKRLQELRQAAWERELQRELSLLFDSFVEWKEGQIDAWELSDRIHKFHNGASSDLYNTYSNPSFGRIDIPLAYALHKGILSLEELPEEARGKLEQLAQFWDRR